jgi:hypothetical protein
LRPFGRIISRDEWGSGVHSRKWSSFSISSDLLIHLLFFINVAEDDDIAITGRPREPTVEVTEESSGELFIP